MRYVKWAAVVLAAGLLFLVFGFLPYWLGGLATTRRFQFPDRENAGLTPASFELPFEDVSLQARDGVALKGWWVPASGARGTVVLLHGLNRSRLEMVRKVPFLHEQGWDALLFDLRHHGASDGSVSGFGYFERQDAAAAVAYARSRAGGPVVLWGVSLGAATAALAAAEDPAVGGLVCDSSYLSLRDTVIHHMGLFRSWRWWSRLVPPWPTGPEVVYWIGRRGGFDPAAVDVRAAVARLAGRPSLFVCNTGDRRMPREIAYELKASAGPPAEVLEVPGNSHGGAWRDGTQAYSRAVAGVLQRVTERAAQRAETTRGREGQSRWAVKTGS